MKSKYFLARNLAVNFSLAASNHLRLLAHHPSASCRHWGISRVFKTCHQIFGFEFVVATRPKRDCRKREIASLQFHSKIKGRICFLNGHCRGCHVVGTFPRFRANVHFGNKDNAMAIFLFSGSMTTKSSSGKPNSR